MDPLKQTFYSNGKLLVTGEYLVLDGAKAFALPTRFGQNLIVGTGSEKMVRWKSYDADGSIWFEATIPFAEIKNKSIFKNEPVKTNLVSVLHEAWLLNPGFLKSEGYAVSTHLTFPKSWGLGTSSTLINNIAQWLQLDAYQLLANSFGGSGYDIACAQHNRPILYQLSGGNPVVTEIDFNPGFREHLYFVYLNRKQNSQSAITSFRKNTRDWSEAISAINLITKAVLTVPDIDAFGMLMENHETIISGILQLEKASVQFPGFKGTVKSLGAWGGDFVLVASKDNPTDYFSLKGFETIIPYAEMIL